MNARYPETSETSNRSTPADKPVHDRTSHYRTGLEYGVARILENEIKPKQRVVEDSRTRRNYVTGELIYQR